MTLTKENFLNLLKIKNEEVYGHSIRTAQIALIICKTYNNLTNNPKINEEQMYNAALFHDFGKLFLPEEILNKHASLNETEYNIIKTHTNVGANFYTALDDDKFIIDGILYHHERADGSGYPERKTKDCLPIQCKIIAIADVYDALASPRCYKSSWQYAQILEFFQKNKHLFDEEIIKILLYTDACKEIQEIYKDF